MTLSHDVFSLRFLSESFMVGHILKVRREKSHAHSERLQCIFVVKFCQEPRRTRPESSYPSARRSIAGDYRCAGSRWVGSSIFRASPCRHTRSLDTRWIQACQPCIENRAGSNIEQLVTSTTLHPLSQLRRDWDSTDGYAILPTGKPFNTQFGYVKTPV